MRLASKHWPIILCPMNRGDGEFDTYVKQSPKKYC